MSPVSLTKTTAAPSFSGSFYQVGRSQTSPHYHQLSIKDAQSCLAHWVVPLPLKQLAKSPVPLWQLPNSSPRGPLTCLETGALQLAPAHLGRQPDLVEGVLRLGFEGHLLRSYYRLQYLPQGGGQLWQLIPIGNV